MKPWQIRAREREREREREKKKTALKFDAFRSQDCNVCGFCILKREIARHCKICK